MQLQNKAKVTYLRYLPDGTTKTLSAESNEVKINMDINKKPQIHYYHRQRQNNVSYQNYSNNNVMYYLIPIVLLTKLINTRNR